MTKISSSFLLQSPALLSVEMPALSGHGYMGVLMNRGLSKGISRIVQGYIEPLAVSVN